ncbi:hypothetical protein CR513_39769, partial [Mucuna pruriens]
MYQGSKSIEEYHRDMELTLTRANMLESNKATMTCFLHRHNRYIQDIVELYHYASGYTSVGLIKEAPDLKEGISQPKRRENATKSSSSVQKQQHKVVQVLGQGKNEIVHRESSRDGLLSISDTNTSREYSPDDEGDCLMVRRLMRQLCSIIIDRGNSVKVTSLRLVDGTYGDNTSSLKDHDNMTAR